MKKARFLLLLILILLLSGCNRDTEEAGVTIGVSINGMRSPFMIGLA